MPKSLPKRARLTDLSVTRMGPGITWDTIVVGLGIRVGKRTRTWIDGDKRRLGRFPQMKVAEARAKARELMEGGVDLLGAKEFHKIVEQFLAHGRTRKGRPLRQNSIDQYRRVFARYAEMLNRLDFKAVTRRDIAELLRDVANESGATSASLVRSMLHRLWEYAISVGEAETNIVHGTPGYEVAKRSRVLSDGEVAAIWACSQQEHDYGLILRLLLWTGARRGEVGGMRWSELGGTSREPPKIWTIPGERCKNGRELVLPLPRQAKVILSPLPRIVGRDCLFGVHSSRGFTGWSEAKADLDARLGFDKPWRLHDLRRTVQTRMIGLGVPHVVVNRILNHAMDPIDETYTHYDFAEEKAKALQSWADELERIVQEHKPKVIQMRCIKVV